MCGIIITKDQMEAKNGFNKLKHRGSDSFGAMNEKGGWYKALTQKALFKGIKKWEEGYVLYHNRKASIGAVTVDLAHPIDSDNKEWTIIHNGTKRSVVEAFDMFSSDTEAVVNIVSNLQQNDDFKNLVDSLLEDSGVVFLRNNITNKLWFYTNSKRTFYINESKTIGASEPLNTTEKWFLVDDTEFTEFEGIEDFLKNVVVHEKGVKIANFKVAKCPVCKNFQTCFHTSNGRCPKCEVLGTKPTYRVTNYYNSAYSESSWDSYANSAYDPLTIPKGALVEWEGFVGVVLKHDNGDYLVTFGDWGTYCEAGDLTQPKPSKFFLEGYNYYFQDSDNGVKTKIPEKSLLTLDPAKNKNYPYRATGVASPYKWVVLQSDHIGKYIDNELVWEDIEEGATND